MHLISVLLLLVMTSFPALAEIYKWTDADGKVHYSDKGVGNGAPIRVQKSTAVDPEAKTKLLQYKNQLDGNRQLKEEKAEQEQQRLAELQTECTQTRNHLRDLEDASQVYHLKDGERAYLDYKEKDALVIQMKQFLKDKCE